jgi:hypothetical protein
VVDVLCVCCAGYLWVLNCRKHHWGTELLIPFIFGYFIWAFFVVVLVSFVVVSLLGVLGNMLGGCSTTELHPNPLLWIKWECEHHMRLVATCWT